MQPDDGPTMPLAGRGRVDPQKVADFFVGQTLEHPQDNYFPIRRVKLADRVPHSAGQFLPADLLAWSGDVARQFHGQPDERLVVAGTELAAGGPPGGVKVESAKLVQAFGGQLPQPQAERDVRAVQVCLKPADGFE